MFLEYRDFVPFGQELRRNLNRMSQMTTLKPPRESIDQKPQSPAERSRFYTERLAYGIERIQHYFIIYDFRFEFLWFVAFGIVSERYAPTDEFLEFRVIASSLRIGKHVFIDNHFSKLSY